MLVEKPELLPVNKELVFQIVDATAEYLDLGPISRYRMIFLLQVWEKTDYSKSYYIEEVMYNGVFSEQYFLDFIETATNMEFIWHWSDIDIAIGAVFIGKITVKVRENLWNHQTKFYNVVAMRHIGFMEEGGKRQ